MSKLHAPMSQFHIDQQQLLIGDKTLAQIEMLVGQTPFYAYDANIVKNTITTLKAALPPQVSLHYAVKANPYLPLVNFIKPLVKGFDVASKKELLLALQTGMSPTNISFAGPGKTQEDITAAIVAGITLHVESTNELASIIELGKQLNTTPNVAIRVNPAFELKASGMRMSGGAKPFGIDEELLPEVLTTLDYDAVNFRGFHIYSGSQNLQADAIIDMHNNTFALAERLMLITKNKIYYINIGGGFGIPYFPGDKRLNTAPIMENLERLFTQYVTLSQVEIIMELGRYLVGECGVYASKVVDIKTSREQKFLVCNGGLHHHLANSGNFGQVIRKNYPVSLGNKMSPENNDTECVTLVGPLCTPLDVLANKIELPKASIGDFAIIYQSGAYGPTASPQDFLSQGRVAEILL
ncbi:pyridoxal-dependent decarboxylase, exosortase A system-associated [Thalassotalea sp. 1_MG-2023]|uniref:pyridoxal-dependent decarboxylase, exosortase A system-associated n=1 Tax=Thalassotalea sp. 1_MG-2023 TaxID=3062680 RepID=UPI0026E13104|nr:pyridoxal-dependent decarboxylase, exosortase A system-associated [Thalassotalea sp. 1_MG-2023]MDO6425592.1 pyridoxal-dependent decarboxylase, exosortase A system-associated [Thalassotalea sp. 1_MG-2023]